ncbi:DUF4249 family protein [Pedobacter sp. L105]|uniref:DUF4249 family protein n=1 Tax=Pedobacter sp. L105 TaxID=1641871 RepID=UPI00131C14E3|nr:DUF4249 family protein [Pedobacter sp. L105]
MVRRISLLYISILTICCCSCDKVIDVKLDDTTARIVIEGEITTAEGPYQVSITESANFTDNNTFTVRDDAKVMISDLTAGTAETLNNIGSGLYLTSSTKGTGGHAYLLTVTLAGKTYTSTSTIPTKAVKLTGLLTEPSALDATKIYMVPVFTDPVGKGNYYRIRQSVNGTLIKGSYVKDDQATDGWTYNTSLYYDTSSDSGNPIIHSGDTLTAELQCVDEGVYTYFRTLSTTIAQDAATPANPISNISNGALGVFNACQSSKISGKAKF